MSNSKQLMQQIQTASVDSHCLKYWWLGQMGVMLKGAGKLISLDVFYSPFAQRLQPQFLLPEDCAGIDYVLGTHDHLDHIDREAWKILAEKNPDTHFVVAQAILPKLSMELSIPASRFIGIQDGVRTTLCHGITIQGIASAHEFLDPDPVTGEYPYMGFVLEIDGIRIYHSGDTCIYEGLPEKLRAAGPFDIMFLPINGRDAQRYSSGIIGNMTYQEAVDLAGAIQPGLVIPCHYDMVEGNTLDPKLFTGYLQAKYPAQAYCICKHGEMYQIMHK